MFLKGRLLERDLSFPMARLCWAYWSHSGDRNTLSEPVVPHRLRLTPHTGVYSLVRSLSICHGAGDINATTDGSTLQEMGTNTQVPCPHGTLHTSDLVVQVGRVFLSSVALGRRRSPSL